MIGRFCAVLCCFLACIEDAAPMRHTICLENMTKADFDVDTSKVFKSVIKKSTKGRQTLITIQPQEQIDSEEGYDEILVNFSNLGESQSREQVAIRWGLKGMVTEFQFSSPDDDFPIYMHYSTSNGPLIRCVFQERDKLSLQCREDLIKKLLRASVSSPKSLAIQTGIRTDKARELISSYNAF